jgi:periplasmic divalent cation tolerance protein
LVAGNWENVVVLVTASSKTEAEAIASALIESKLAACVSCFPVDSLYIWQGKVNSDQEWQLLIKTNLRLFDDLSEKIQELHSYEVPEIIALPIIAGSQTYLNWLGKNIR